jgi:hypothetical protein
MGLTTSVYGIPLIMKLNNRHEYQHPYNYKYPYDYELQFHWHTVLQIIIGTP